MRYVLLVLFIALTGALGWHAALVGTDLPYLSGVPQINAKVAAGAKARVAEVSDGTVAVAVDGRKVTVSGIVSGQDQKAAVIAAARSVPMAGKVTDRLSVVAIAVPFTFEAEKRANGTLVLRGYAPDEETKDRILGQSPALTGGLVVESELSIAGGMPEIDWSAAVETGLTALALLDEGTFALSDLEAILSGPVAGFEVAEQVRAITEKAPDLTWGLALEGADRLAGAYLFNALKTMDGGIIIKGYAPDEAAAQTLLVAVEEAATGPVDGELTIIAGSPGPDWPDLVVQGLNALGTTQSGFLNITNRMVELKGEVRTNDDLATLLTEMGSDWVTDIKVLNAPDPANVTISLDPDGSIRAEGILPDGLNAATFATMLPGMDVAGLDPEKRGQAVDWTPSAEVMNIALPRLKSAVITLTGTKLAVTGILRPEYTAAESTTAIRTAMKEGWDLDMDLREAAAPAEATISKRGDEIALRGVLPLGLPGQRALSTLGLKTGGDGLSSDGDGSARAWDGALTTLAGGMVFFSSLTGEISEGALRLSGTLLPGYPAKEVEGWLGTRLPEGWLVSLSAEETVPAEGDTRTNPAIGAEETFRNGFWLADLTFPVSIEACESATETAFAGEQITFLTGSDRIDDEGAALLSRLAAVANRCLANEEIGLEIGGHTDSFGNASFNLRLSEERAQAVRSALVARGVNVEAIAARGYGETQPVASNDTQDGRARNRRIDFVWSRRDVE